MTACAIDAEDNTYVTGHTAGNPFEYVTHVCKFAP
jgi:hypothetical protein